MDGRADNDEIEITITITISRKAFEKAKQRASDQNGPAGELAGLITAEEYIEFMVEAVLD